MMIRRVAILLVVLIMTGVAVYAQSIGSNNGISNVVGGGGGGGGGSASALVLFIP